MALSETFRKELPRTLQIRFKTYWHAMHPVDFKVKPIYRAGFDKEEWHALMVLRERRVKCVVNSTTFRYWDDVLNISLRFHMPKKYEGFPHIVVRQTDVSPETRKHLAEWHNTSKRYDELHTLVCSYARDLLAVDSEKRSVNGINTIRQLYAIWPELLPFFWASDRDTIRGTKVKPKLPAHWDQSYVERYMTLPRMDEINHALTVMTLIPDVTDEKYPDLC